VQPPVPVQLRSRGTDRGNAGGGTSASVAQAAGIVSQPHYANLDNVLRAISGQTGQTYSNPVLYNNVIWHNRAFSWTPRSIISTARSSPRRTTRSTEPERLRRRPRDGAESQVTASSTTTRPGTPR